MSLAEQITGKVTALEGALMGLEIDNQSLSLMNGKPGLVLLQFRLFQTTGEAQYRDKAARLIDEILEDLSAIGSFSYCDGLAGIAFLFQYLHEQRFLDDGILPFLEECDGMLIKALHRMLDKKDIDFLHGATGLGHYLLNRHISGHLPSPVIHDVFEQLKDVVTDAIESGVPLNEFIRDLHGVAADRYINLGMAHGLVSVLLLLSKYYSRVKSTEAFRLLTNELANYIIRFKSNNDNTLAAYPSIVKVKGETWHTIYNIPLGWCYGDAVISLGLYQAGKVLNNEALMDTAYQLALRTTKRSSPETSLVRDACFCHGSASMAHIYRKWFWYSGNPIFNELYDHWIRETISLCNHQDGIAGYKKFAGHTFSNEYGILDGACGVALVLSDYPRKQSDWDSFFLLS